MPIVSYFDVQEVYFGVDFPHFRENAVFVFSFLLLSNVEKICA